MTTFWLLLTLLAMGLFAYAAARWGADSRDESYTMARVTDALPGRAR